MSIHSFNFKSIPSSLLQCIYSFDNTYSLIFNIVLKELLLTYFIKYWDKQRSDYFNLLNNSSNPNSNYLLTPHFDGECILVLKRKQYENKKFIALFSISYHDNKKWYRLLYPTLRHPAQTIRGTIHLRRSWNWKYFEVSEKYIFNHFKVKLVRENTGEIYEHKTALFDTWFKYNIYYPRKYFVDIDFELDEIDHLDIFSEIQKIWLNAKKDNYMLKRVYKVWLKICFGNQIRKEVYKGIEHYLCSIHSNYSN